MKGAGMASYGFGEGHPFGPDRHDAFHARLAQSQAPVRTSDAPAATREQLALFHSSEYVDWVAERSSAGQGFLDGGDTPVVPGIFEAACYAVGSSLTAIDAIMSGDATNAFAPIAGLHHGRRKAAAGFCVFNDCGVAIEYLRHRYGLSRVAYVDIDAHHGDGVFYEFEDDPEVPFADVHEDGRYLYPGTGHREENGRGPAQGTKLNIPLPPGAGDDAFDAEWDAVEQHIARQRPEFILLQCGADSIEGDPITHLAFTPASHAKAARRLALLADEVCEGRILAMGGGGYNRDNLAAAWTAVVEALASPS